MQQPPPNPHSTGPQQALPPQQFPRGHHHHSPHPHMHQPPPHSLPPQAGPTASVVTQVNPTQNNPGQQPGIRFIYQIQPQPGQEAGGQGAAGPQPGPHQPGPPQAQVFMQPSTANSFMVIFLFVYQISRNCDSFFNMASIRGLVASDWPRYGFKGNLGLKFS